MTYDQIYTLDTIVKYGSFKAASSVLHKTQPSLSTAIKKLEEEYSIQLFDRSGYRPTLTEQGKAFHKKSLNVIEEFQKLEKLAQEMGANIESEISICIDAIFPISSIESILGSFFEPHITTTLNINIDILEGILEKLLSHTIDFALGTVPRHSIDTSKVEGIRICTIPMLPVIGKKHENKCSDFDQVRDIPQIILKSSNTKENDKVYGGVAKQYWFTTDLSMKEQLIESGFGWGRLPLHLIEEKIKKKSLIEISKIPEIQKANIDLYLLRSKTKIMGPNTKRLWDYLKSMNQA